MGINMRILNDIELNMVSGGFIAPCVMLSIVYTNNTRNGQLATDTLPPQSCVNNVPGYPVVSPYGAADPELDGIC